LLYGLDSFVGPIHVEWDSKTAFTPLGQLPFFIDFVKTAGPFDAFVAKLRQAIVSLSLMDRCPELQIKHYEFDAQGSVDCLLVIPRKMGEPPYKFTKTTKYGSHVWIRDGHNVAKTEPKHFPILYCRTPEQNGAEGASWLAGSLPPSPRTLSKFIGRLGSMDRLFDWLFTSDEPQMYLYGKGGSGKTTIAHEFATILKRFGSIIKIYGNQKIDLVLFLSVKERRFMSGDQNVVVAQDVDFYDEQSLF
jgi:hypothetical protein